MNTTAIEPNGTLLDHLPAGVIFFVDGVIRYVNPAAVHLAQAPDAEHLLGQTVDRFIHPLDMPRVLARIRLAEEGPHLNPPTEYRILTCTGEVRMVALSSTHYIHNGEHGVLASFLDMSERAEMEARLRETDENFTRIMNTMQDVFYRTDAQGITRYVCPAVVNVLGFTAEEIVGKLAADFYPDPEDRRKLIEAIKRDGAVRDFPGQMQCKDRRVIDISISSQVLLDDDGHFAGVEGIWRDITERKNLERELERLATRDDLTGIANRRKILEQLDLSIRRYQRNGNPLSILLLDLDFFKLVNDEHGHVAGDKVLKRFVSLVHENRREVDLLGRLGGEEFLLILEDATVDTARFIAERIRRGIAHADFPIDNRTTLKLTVSIGMTEAVQSDRHPVNLLERADKALYRAKDNGRNQVQW